MYFRPFPLLTAFSIPALVALLWLGVWQGQRAQWKADEVAGFAQKLAAPATPLADICARGLAEQQILGTPPAAGPAVRVFGTRASGKAGWKLVGFVDQHAWEPPFGHYDRGYPGFEPYAKERRS